MVADGVTTEVTLLQASMHSVADAAGLDGGDTAELFEDLRAAAIPLGDWARLWKASGHADAQVERIGVGLRWRSPETLMYSADPKVPGIGGGTRRGLERPRDIPGTRARSSVQKPGRRTTRIKTLMATRNAHETRA
jgi:hypothetical protein